LTSSVLDAPADLLGAQRPRVANVPPHRSTKLGRDAVALARKCGLTLHPWQEWVLEQSLATGDDGLLAAPDVGLVVSRQNGKGEVIVARQIAGLFLLDEPLQVYTSHLFTTTKEMHRRLKMALLAYPPFAARVRSITTGNTEVKVELKNGQRVNFLARNAGSGRGFSTDSTLYLDEAMHLSDAEQDALVPTITAARDPQVWYCGSAGIGEPSRVFARFRRRGLAGDDRLLWCEWSVPDEASPDDVGTWPLANPGLGYGQVSLRGLQGYRVGMSGDGFAREYLGRGDWPDDGPSSVALSPELWAQCLDRGSQVERVGAFGVHVTGDRQTAFTAAVGSRADGLAHVEIVGESQPHNAVARLVELHQRWHAPVVIDPGSHAGSMIQPLEEASVPVLKIKLQEITAAGGALIDAVNERSVRHIGQVQLDDAVRGSSVRTTARDAWAWKGPAVTPLMAATLALHGFLTAPVYDVEESVW
jgi:hypothetical protein